MGLYGSVLVRLEPLTKIGLGHRVTERPYCFRY